MRAPSDVITRIDAILSEFLADRTASLGEVGPELDDVAAAARRVVLDGGKRLRPRFAYWGWRSVHGAGEDGAEEDGAGEDGAGEDGAGEDGAGEDDAALMKAAASLELLHACALVHDDVMDASDTRRGRPAAHVAFATLHARAGWIGDSAAFGQAAAILVGDLLLSWSDALFAESGCTGPPRRYFDAMHHIVVAGQYLDVHVQARAAYSPDDALRVTRFKTAKYTVEGPLHLGAAIGGAPPDTLAALSAYGLPLGEAFQLRDDVLGVFGDPTVTGKPAGDDLREGKQTLLVALAMQRGSAAQQRELRDSLGRRGLGDAEVAELRSIIESTGALDAVEKRIGERADEARAALETDAIRPDARAALQELAVSAVERRS